MVSVFIVNMLLVVFNFKIVMMDLSWLIFLLVWGKILEVRYLMLEEI